MMHVLQHRRKAFRSGGGGLLFDEGFEGVGTPASWFQGGSADFDYAASPIDGLESLRLASATTDSAILVPVSTLPEVWIKFRFRIQTAMPGATGWVCVMYDTNSVNYFNIHLDPGGTLTMDLATYTVAAMSANVSYYVWLHRRAGTGTSGALEFFFNTTDTRPARGGNNHLGSNAMDAGALNTAEIKWFSFQANPAYLIDNVQVSADELT